MSTRLPASSTSSVDWEYSCVEQGQHNNDHGYEVAWAPGSSVADITLKLRYFADLSTDTPGPTYLSYTPNGKKLITAGPNTALKVFQHGSDGEPVIIDVQTENHLAVAASDDFFLIGSEDGLVTKYSLLTNRWEELLLRCTLPVRHIALSPDNQWAAVASE